MIKIKIPKIKLPRTDVIFKDDAIISICTGRNVLHLGATDFPFHKERAKKGILLHQKIKKVASSLIGLDVNRSAIVDLKTSGIDDIFYGDLIKGTFSKDILRVKQGFDVIIFGDVIEHLDNPGLALQNIKKFMSKKTLLIVTCPNMHCLHNYKSFFNGKEDVHPDHVMWPSFVTTKNLLINNDYKLLKFNYCMWGSKDDFRGARALVYCILMKMKPYLASAMFFRLKIR